MKMLLDRLAAIRAGLLLYLLVPAVLWIVGVSGSPSGGSVYGAILLTGGLVALALLHAILFDRRTVLGGTPARLRHLRETTEESGDFADQAMLALSGLVVLASLLLLAVSVSAALLLLIVLGCVWLFTRGLTMRSRRWRLIFVEVIWPLAMLIAPMMIVGGVLLEGDEGLDARSVHGTALFGLGLAAFLLLCMLRDQPLDVSEGVRTAVTQLGRSGGVVLLFIVLSTAVLVGIRGVDADLWHWSVGTIVAIGGMATLLLVALDDEGDASCLWTVTMALSGVILLFSGG